eukprot:1585699-Rhodomonas_salina.3
MVHAHDEYGALRRAGGSVGQRTLILASVEMSAATHSDVLYSSFASSADTEAAISTTLAPVAFAATSAAADMAESSDSTPHVSTLLPPPR